MAYTAPGLPERVVLMDAQSTDETLGLPYHATGRPFVTIYVQGNGTTSSGVVTLETASYAPGAVFAGTWSDLTTVNASDVSGGKQKAIVLAPGTVGRVRPRISTAIGGGGTVSVFVEAA